VVLSQFSVVGVCGSRRAPAALRAPVGALVRAALGSGCALACGCASGVDALAVAAAVASGAASRLSLFAAFGPGGAGALGRSSSVAGVAAAAAAGASVVWWAGGPLPVPPRARLAQRSLALVRSLSPSGVLVAFVAGPPPRPFGRGPFPSCGSGSWSSVAAAARAGVPVVVVGCAPPVPGAPHAGFLPVLPSAGAWSPVALPGGALPAFRWSPPPGLFG